MDREMKRKYQREWYAARRKAWFADKLCLNCGTNERLVLDHIDPLQKTTHRIWSYRQEKREAELAKCQPLCLPCHKIKTKIMGDMKLGRNRQRALRA